MNDKTASLRIDAWGLYDCKKPGEYVWAASIADKTNTVGVEKYPHTPPTYGMITLSRTKVLHDSLAREWEPKFPKSFKYYFTPCKNGPGSELLWDKTVESSSRFYAETEDGIKAVYNQAIQDRIDWHQAKIQGLEVLKVN